MDQITALQQAVLEEGFRGYDLNPQLAEVDNRLCNFCWELYGIVYPQEVAPTTEEIRRNSHFFCRCSIKWMRSILAGTATVKGSAGADYYQKYIGDLPDIMLIKMKPVKKAGYHGKEICGIFFRVLNCARLMKTEGGSFLLVLTVNGIQRISITLAVCVTNSVCSFPTMDSFL